MDAETNGVRSRRSSGHSIDATDRKILGLLANDSTRSYADLAQDVNLSAPAVFERVKRMKAQGIIKRSTIQIDGAKVGRPLLAFVQATFSGWGPREGYAALSADPDIEEVHSVAGDACLLLKVRCSCPEGLEALLSRLYDMGSLLTTRTYMVLSTYEERGPSAEVTPTTKGTDEQVKAPRPKKGSK